jgi:hypothetical protein
MDRGLVVLACPGSGGTRDRLVANLIVFDLLHAAKGRAELSPERTPVSPVQPIPSRFRTWLRAPSAPTRYLAVTRRVASPSMRRTLVQDV